MYTSRLFCFQFCFSLFYLSLLFRCEFLVCPAPKNRFLCPLPSPLCPPLSSLLYLARSSRSRLPSSRVDPPFCAILIVPDPVCTGDFCFLSSCSRCGSISSCLNRRVLVFFSCLAASHAVLLPRAFGVGYAMWGSLKLRCCGLSYRVGGSPGCSVVRDDIEISPVCAWLGEPFLCTRCRSFFQYRLFSPPISRRLVNSTYPSTTKTIKFGGRVPKSVCPTRYPY